MNCEKKDNGWVGYSNLEILMHGGNFFLRNEMKIMIERIRALDRAREFLPSRGLGSFKDHIAIYHGDCL